MRIADVIECAIWKYPIPLECKSRRNNGDRQAKSAVLQLLEYWRSIPDIAGYGIFAQIDVNPVTRIRLHFFAPKTMYINEIRSIVTGNTAGTTLPTLTDEPTCSEFNRIIGVRLLG